MSAEHFKIIKEINSLSTKRDSLNSEIAEQVKRINFIESNRLKRQDELDSKSINLKDIKAQLQNTENEIAKLQAMLDKDKANLNSVFTDEQLKSLELAIQTNEEKLVPLEEDGLNLLEKIDCLEQEIKEAVSFLSGSEETLKEITQEVDAFNESHNKEISILDNRIHLLLEQLPVNFKDKVTSVLEKKIKISSFTRIQANKCEFCKYSLSNVDVSNIEDKLQLKSCTGCGRLFMPQQAPY